METKVDAVKYNWIEHQICCDPCVFPRGWQMKNMSILRGKNFRSSAQIVSVWKPSLMHNLKASAVNMEQLTSRKWRIKIVELNDFLLRRYTTYIQEKMSENSWASLMKYYILNKLRKICLIVNKFYFLHKYKVPMVSLSNTWSHWSDYNDTRICVFVKNAFNVSPE